MAPPLPERKKIAVDTISRSEAVTQEHVEQGASADSIFIPDQLAPLGPSKAPGHSASVVTVVNADAFTIARNIMNDDPDAKGKTTVLNLASDIYRAGGWEEVLSTTQEEALCYTSTLYLTLKPSYYPWPNLGPGSVAGVYSPGIVIFKDDLDHNCVELPKADRRVVSVITVAAPRFPALTKDGTSFKNSSDLEDLRGKIRLVYRMAAHNGQQYLVLGAMGCGAYYCPPEQVADEMKSILLEDEFKGWFKKIVFAVYSTLTNGWGNFEIFKETFEGVEV